MDTCFPLLKLKRLCESDRRERDKKRETNGEEKEESKRAKEKEERAHC